ncbi:fibronectin type III domain-containing protein [Candidatus Falkowbacteria bacterium]|nr:fibronectin type III domain-containing protein [Candidatus Falkowbacteria bacterium]
MKKMTAILTVLFALTAALFANQAQAVCVAGAAPSKINDVKVVVQTEKSIIISFTVPAAANTIVSYDIRYRTDVPLNSLNWSSATKVTEDSTQRRIPGETDVAVLRNLWSSTNHYVGVRVTDECGKMSPLSNIPQISTLAFSPDKAILVLSWGYSEADEATIDGFRVYYGNISRLSPDFTEYPSKTEVNKNERVVPMVFEKGPQFYMSLTAHKNGVNSPYSNEIQLLD